MDAKTKYQKINVEMDTKNCDFLISNALSFKNEFYLGIGKDKENIMIAQTKLKSLKIENMQFCLGNIEKILPFIKDKSIDNFILDVTNEKEIDKSKQSLKDIFYIYNSKFSPNGTILLIIKNNQNYEEIISLVPEKKFKIVSITKNTLPKDTLYSNSIDYNKLEDTEIITIAKIDE
jgi:hypothetical protein